DKDNWLTRSVDYVAQVVRAVERREALEGEGVERDYDALEEAFRTSLRGYGRRMWEYGSSYGLFGGGYKRSDVVSMRNAVHADWQRILLLADGELASLLREDLRSLVDLYAKRLERRGALDFTGLLLRARDLLQGDSALRAEMRAKYTHILVDEFQDTDPIQVEILRALTCADDSRTPLPGRLFLVGDPKQSIYRFRRADVRLYESVKKELCAGDAPASKLIYLTTNFRSCASIIELCNSTFAPAFAAQGDRQPAYVAMVASCPDPRAQPTVVGLPVPRPYSDKTSKPKVTNWAVEQSYPDAVAGYVQWLVEKSGWTVRSGEARVPIEARHVCLLFRRFASFGEDLTRPYVRALEARKIPHVLVGGRSFYAREEIQATLCALSAIERPDDELAVYASLKGPFFALTDDALFAYRTAVGKRDGHAGA
ncbi:MAG: ATP-dependent deoxyribonuclease subunit A, partial [Proteobacteria bacterium]